MKIVAGQVVTGDNFYPGRLDTVRRLGEELKLGDVLLVGPRRTGKTSVIQEYLRQQSIANPGFRSVYIDLEQTRDLYQFYLRIIRDILKALASWKHTLWHTGGDRFKAFVGAIGKVLPGFEVDLSDYLGSPTEIPLKIKFPAFEPKKVNELRQQLGDLLSQLDKPIVLVLDEFPELIWKLGTDTAPAEQERSRKEQAEQMLAGLRAIRQEKREVSHRIIIAGSVNLQTTVEHLQLLTYINDLNKFEIPYLSPDQAEDLMSKLDASEGFTYQDIMHRRQFIAANFGRCSPFLIQLFAQRLLQCKLQNSLSEFEPGNLEVAYKEVLVNKNGPETLVTRIKKYYDSQEAVVFEVLKLIASRGFENGSAATDAEVAQLLAGRGLVERLHQSNLLAKMSADDLIQVAQNGWEIASPALLSFWHQKLVGPEFLRTKK